MVQDRFILINIQGADFLSGRLPTSRERPGVQVLFGCGRGFLHEASKSWRTGCAPFQRWVMTLDLEAETQLISIVLSCPALSDHGASSSWPARDMVGHLPRRLVSNSAADSYTAVCSRTVDDCAAGLGQASQGCARIPWHMGCQEVIKPSVCETRVSCSGSRTTACDPHAVGGAQCGEQRRPSPAAHQDWSSLGPHRGREHHGRCASDTHVEVLWDVTHCLDGVQAALVYLQL